MGSHPRTRAEFDFNRTDCDIWLFNEAVSNGTFPRADAVFQMHEEAIWRNPANRNDPRHVEWLTTQAETLVYMQEQYTDVPKSVRYPLDEIVARYKLNYFTSSIAYAIALACYLNYKRIEIYGVEMETNTEYQYQRDGVTLWVGVAVGQGIEVDLHISMLKDSPLYGYQGEVVIKYERFDERIAELTPNVQEAAQEYQKALMNVNAAVAQFEQSGDDKTETALYQAMGYLVQVIDKRGVLEGAMQENERYKSKADKMREASGGEFLFSRQEFESSAKILRGKTAEAHTKFIAHGTTLGHIHDAIKKAAKGSPKRQKLIAEFHRHMTNNYLPAASEEAVYRGASQENLQMMAWLDKRIRAAGGAKSEAVLLERMAAQ